MYQSTFACPPLVSCLERVFVSLFLLAFARAAGVKFFVIATPDSDDIDRTLRSVYEIYADFVLKNPFYESDMPIKCDLFDQGLTRLIKG
jgi:hypothetical protein